MPTFSDLALLLERPPITWWDVLDILIVSVIVYELLKLIRGTRAVPLAVGIAVIVGLFYFSRGLQLDTLHWLIRNIVGYVVFAAIVLLQADIRRALVHLGRAPLFRRFERAESDEDVIEELVVAATTLSAKKTGAIIVIERSIGLLNFIESGIPLDAKLTYDLLVAVFQPSSPLHDGAVIVQGDRVAAGACFLPLTVNPRLSRQMGSRHRAAIGVTEENDSVAIVVSEETGVISIVQDGDLEQVLDASRLRARLKAVITVRRTQAGREAGYILRLMAPFPFRNFGLKFLSICIAVLLWLVVGGEGVVERVLRAPMEYQNLPAGLELVGNLPETVDVRVRRSSGALSRMVPGDLSIVLDLRTVQPGRRVFNLIPSQVRAPFGVDAVQVSPSSVTVEFEAAGLRSIPVQVEITGRPAPGFEVGAVTVEPKTVEIAGPVGALQGVTAATTEPVSVANASKTIKQTVAIGVPSANARLRVPQSAVVTVSIERRRP